MGVASKGWDGQCAVFFFPTASKFISIVLFCLFLLLSTKPGSQPAKDNNILTENLMHPTRVIYIVWDPCASEITRVENKRITQQKGLDESKQEKRDLLLKHFPACS